MKVKLIDDEKILFVCRHHWSLFLLPIVFVIIGLVLFSLDSLLEMLSFIFFTLSLATYYWALKRYCSHRYILTNKRLIIIESWLGVNTTDVLVNKIEGVKIKTLPFTNTGSMTILCSGGSQYRYNILKSPKTIRDHLAQDSQ